MTIMSNFSVHPTAIVSNQITVGNNVTIGPFTIIEEDVEIGNNVEIRSSAYIAAGTRIADNCRIHSGVVIGTEPQDLKFKGERTYVYIGENTVLREFVTVNRATMSTTKTIVGSNCLIMTYCHIAHDCRIGNNVIMANATQLAGHVSIEDWATIGGLVGIHQFSKIGCHSMIGAHVKVAKDIPPYVLIAREPARIEGINKIGLKRKGFSNELIKEIENFYDLILFSGFNNREGIAKYLEREIIPDEVKHCIDFIQDSTRGIYR